MPFSANQSLTPSPAIRIKHPEIVLILSYSAAHAPIIAGDYLLLNAIFVKIEFNFETFYLQKGRISCDHTSGKNALFCKYRTSTIEVPTSPKTGIFFPISPSRQGSGKKGGAQAQALGRSRGGFRTKIHAVVDALGLPVRFMLGPGQQPAI